MAVTQTQYNSLVASNTAKGISTPTIGVVNGIGLPSGYTAPALTSISAAALSNPVQTAVIPNQPALTAVPPPNLALATTTSSVSPEMQGVLDMYANNTAPSMENQYNQDVNNANISELGGNVATANNAVAQEQANLSTIQAQLSAVSSAGTQAQLQLESGASGKDVTSTFLGRQQQEVARQAGIQALPLQASALASQAKIQGLQGNAQAAQTLLTQAQNQVDKLFQIQSQDSQNMFNYQNKMIDVMYDMASKSDQAKLDAKKLEIANQHDIKMAEINNGYQVKRDELAREQAVNMENLNYQHQLGAAAYDASLKGTGAPDVKSINGVDMQWNPTTGTWESIGGGTTNVESQAQAQGNINNISDLLKSGGISSAVGPNILSRSATGFWGSVGKIATIIGIPGFLKDTVQSATGQKQNFISGVEQLSSQLSLNSLVKAKQQGATFGALSDTEMKILSSSASKLGTWVQKDKNGNVTGYNTTEKAFKAELDKINNFAKLDYLLKGGNPADVGVQQMEDGTYWTQNSDGSLTQLQ